MRVAVRFFAFSALAMLLAMGASAQLSKGFRGRVLDMGGKPVVGLAVEFQDQANAGNHYEVKTDSHGEYVQIGMPYSNKGYTVSVQPPGLPLMSMTLKAKLVDVTELIFDPRKNVGFQGTVKDKQGKTVSGATVTIVNLADEAHPLTAKTDDKGLYRKLDLPCSEKGYKITAQIPGGEPLAKAFSIPKLQGQHESQPGEGPVYHQAVLEVNFDFANPSEGATGGASPTPSLAFDAKAMFELADYEGALGKADEAIAANDNVNTAKLIKATCLSRLDRRDDAIAAFEDYNKSNPGEMNILGELYKLYDKKGDKAKAEQYRKEYVAKGGQITGLTYNEGVNALNAGNAQRASELFAQAIKENPADPDAHRELARCYAQQGKFQETVDELKIYLKMKPNADDAATWKSAIQGLEQVIQQQHKK